MFCNRRWLCACAYATVHAHCTLCNAKMCTMCMLCLAYSERCKYGVIQCRTDYSFYVNEYTNNKNRHAIIHRQEVNKHQSCEIPENPGKSCHFRTARFVTEIGFQKNFFDQIMRLARVPLVRRSRVQILNLVTFCCRFIIYAASCVVLALC